MRTPRSLLRRAIRERNVEAVAALLSGGVSPNDPVNLIFSPLQLAAEVGDTAVVSLLLDAGADPAWTNRSGWSAVTVADANGFDDIAAILIAKGADPDTRHAHGYSDLHRAVIAGDLAAMAGLSDQIPVDGKDSAGETALMLAIRQRHLPAVDLLLDAGADPNAVVTDWPILTEAAYQDAFAGRTELVELLLAHGANPNPSGYPPVAAAISQEGSSLDVIGLLIAAGADINAGDHETALHRAAGMIFDDGQTVRRLVELGASLETRDSDGKTPLLAAVWNENPGNVSALIECGADVTAIDNAGRGAGDLIGDNEASATIRQLFVEQ